MGDSYITKGALRQHADLQARRLGDVSDRVPGNQGRHVALPAAARPRYLPRRIVAAGSGRRTKPCSRPTPKSLFEVVGSAGRAAELGRSIPCRQRGIGGGTSLRQVRTPLSLKTENEP